MAGLGVGLAGLVLLSACTGGPVQIEDPGASALDRAACETFLEAVPDRLASQEQRAVAPADALGAAWGDPAITLTCGVSLPDDFDAFATCEEANGVGWFVSSAEREDQESDVTFTAAGFRPIVQVHLPASYRPEGAAAVISQLAEPVRDHLTLVQPCT